MKTLRISLLPLLIASGFLLQGCGTTPVAKAQQVTHVAVVNLDKFVQFEKANRAALWAVNPQIKHFTDSKLRKRECETCKPNGQRYVETAISMVDAYKDNRTPENQANMDTAIAIIQELINQISAYFLNPQIANLDRETALTYSNVKVIP